MLPFSGRLQEVAPVACCGEAKTKKTENAIDTIDVLNTSLQSRLWGVSPSLKPRATDMVIPESEIVKKLRRLSWWNLRARPWSSLCVCSSAFRRILS